MNDTHDKLVQKAKLIGENWSILSKLIESKNGCAHFRPKRDGFSLVSLLPASAQCGRPWSFKTISTLEKTFEKYFQLYCTDRKAKKNIPEARVQSHIIRESYRHERNLNALSEGHGSAKSFCDVHFVMDEIAVPGSNGKGDILAVKKIEGEFRLVVIEIKYGRSEAHRDTLVKQLSVATENIHDNTRFYEEICKALLRRKKFKLDGKVERWIIWPRESSDGNEVEEDREEELLAKLKIGVIQYQQLDDWRYEFHIGNRPEAVTR